MRLYRSLLTFTFITVLLASPLLGQEDNSSKQDQNTQKRIGWLGKHAIKLKSSNPAKSKFKDLMPLKEKIGDARIVLIGEQTHGHGTSHRMKCRLIRFLHEEMGFNVLAWESSLPGCRAMDEAFLNSDGSLMGILQLGLFGVFSLSKHNLPLFEYIREIRKGDNPLIQAGFDFQYSGYSTIPVVVEMLSDFFNNAQAGLLPQDKINDLQRLLREANRWSDTQEPPMWELIDLTDYLLSLYEDNKTLLEQFHSQRELAFHKQVIENIKLHADYNIHFFARGDVWFSGESYRDRVMADNISFLAKEYFPDDKIIVWAASYHNMRNDDLIEVYGYRMYQRHIIMGEYVFQEFGDQTYSIGFITYEGECHFVLGYNHEIIQPAPEGTLSWYFHELGGKYYFLDFKALKPGHWLRGILPERPFTGNRVEYAPWPEVFDAFVYIKKTNPAQSWY